MKQENDQFRTKKSIFLYLLSYDTAKTAFWENDSYTPVSTRNYHVKST